MDVPPEPAVCASLLTSGTTIAGRFTGTAVARSATLTGGYSRAAVARILAHSSSNKDRLKCKRLTVKGRITQNAGNVKDLCIVDKLDKQC